MKNWQKGWSQILVRGAQPSLNLKEGQQQVQNKGSLSERRCLSVSLFVCLSLPTTWSLGSFFIFWVTFISYLFSPEDFSLHFFTFVFRYFCGFHTYLSLPCRLKTQLWVKQGPSLWCLFAGLCVCPTSPEYDLSVACAIFNNVCVTQKNTHIHTHIHTYHNCCRYLIFFIQKTFLLLLLLHFWMFHATLSILQMMVILYSRTAAETKNVC